MAIQIAGGGHLGVAKELTFGTFVTAAKYIPIMSETLERKQSNTLRKSIRGLAEAWGVKIGPYHVEGQVKLELTADAMAWFLYGMRGAVVKTGTASPYTYTFTPDAGSVSVTGRTLSFSVLRAGKGFGYAGIMIVGIELMFNQGILEATLDCLGMNDTTYTPTTQTFAPQNVFGFPDNQIKIAGTQRTDIDNFTFTVKENSEARNTISGTAAASYIVHRERVVTAKFESDFDGAAYGATDYSNFTGITPVTLEILASQSATNNQIDINVPQAYYDSYPVVLNGIGDLVRAVGTLTAVYDGTATDSYNIVVKTTENIT